MKLALNGWQRLRVVISVLLLIPAAFLVVVFWPYPEGDLIKELGSPACKMWRDVPDGYFIDESPSYPSECYNLRALLNNKIILRSVADYDKHLVRTKVKVILMLSAYGSA